MQIVLNGKEWNSLEPATVSRLLEELKLQPVRVAVEVNEQLVPRTTFERTILQDGDRVEIVTFVGGG